jgi:hypothetical protein
LSSTQGATGKAGVGGTPGTVKGRGNSGVGEREPDPKYAEQKAGYADEGARSDPGFTGNAPVDTK